MTNCCTVTFSGLVNCLKSESFIGPAFDRSSLKGDQLAPEKHNAVKFQAIWDTGATNTVITQAVVDQCKLKPIGITQVHTVNGIRNTRVYFVSLYLPNKLVIPHLRVTEGLLPEGDSILIGMDVINKGDFAVTNLNGITTFSFRVPSITRIDFVERPEGNPNEIRERITRSAPCPCGSGKKYKRCCGK